jgi:CRP-like cAMP-binding protein
MGPTLRREVQQHTYLSLLRSFGIFLPSSVISDGCHGRAILEEAINKDGFVGCVMSPGEILYHANEFSKGLYFVLEGSVVFSFAKHVVMSLGEQAVVGVGATFTRSLVTAQAAVMCDTYVLKRDVVNELCAEFPVFKSRIRAQSRVTLIFAVTTISKVKQYFRRWIDVSFGMGTWMKGKKSRGRTSHRTSVSLAAVAPPDAKTAGINRADTLPPVTETTEADTNRLGPSVAAEEMLQRLHDRLDEHEKLLRGDGGVMAKLDQILKAIGTGTTEGGVVDGKLKLVPLV